MNLSPSRSAVVIADLLLQRGLLATLNSLNAGTPFRYTGVYRFDSGTLRSVALFDRHAPDLSIGSDAPMGETFCAITGSSGSPLIVVDGSTDRRFPWMQTNAVKSYCGAPISSDLGETIGTLCHFDLKPCETLPSETDLLMLLAPQFRQYVS